MSLTGLTSSKYSPHSIRRPKQQQRNQKNNYNTANWKAFKVSTTSHVCVHLHPLQVGNHTTSVPYHSMGHLLIQGRVAKKGHSLVGFKGYLMPCAFCALPQCTALHTALQEHSLCVQGSAVFYAIMTCGGCRGQHGQRQVETNSGLDCQLKQIEEVVDRGVSAKMKSIFDNPTSPQVNAFTSLAMLGLLGAKPLLCPF